jgi:predicted small lipoprotein YifL
MRYRSMIRLLLLITAVTTSTGQLAGCGQKGPLYLPDEPQDTEENQE